ncbi:MAG: serine hydrolase [Peptoniphilaceae bacterium]|nr:serine hydrolase [Peptoniphilaceae bacterium]MDY6086342.1 serine hydrolase [Peptoniphilaceae bacterium]
MEFGSKSKRRRKSRLLRHILFFGIVIGLVCWGAWALKPENFRPQKRWLRNAVTPLTSDIHITYHADGLYALNLTKNATVASKRENEPLLPASLAKLFVVQYATTVVENDAMVTASADALALLKPESSVAGIAAGKEYAVADLYAGMLVASGNDAAYVLADAVAQQTHPEIPDTDSRIAMFMDDVNDYARKMGWRKTKLYDPSGYDFSAVTSAADVADVCQLLLENEWFRDMVASPTYVITRPDSETQTFVNTNKFLLPDSTEYEPAVHGVKTGSLDGSYNLVALFTDEDEEYLIVSLGSDSDEARYDDVRYVMRSIDGEE